MATNLKKSLSGSARVVHVDSRAAIQLTVPAGTSITDIAAHPQSLVETFKRLGPRGCAPCLSGLPLIIKEEFEDVIAVEFG